MALTPDQRAMLQLLLERRQSYEDISSLLGLSAGEVRSRARGILTDLGGEDPDKQVGLTDYLLGQADPIGRADVARHLQGDPETLELAHKLSTQLQVLAPGAELPELPPSKGGGPKPGAAAGTPAAVEPAGSGGSPSPTAPEAQPRSRRSFLGRIRNVLGDSQGRVIAALVASTIIVIGIVLAVSGTFGGGKDKSSDSGADSGEVPLTLTAPNGGKAKGEAVFATTGGQTNQVAFRLVAEGLTPSPRNQTYTVWLFIDPKHAYPLTPLAVGSNGKVNVTRPIPSIFTSTQAGVQVLSRFQGVQVSLAPTKELTALIQGAVKKKEPLVPYLGDTVLQGAIPKQAAGSTGTQTQP